MVLYVLDDPHQSTIVTVTKSELVATYEDERTRETRFARPGHVFGPFRSARDAKKYIGRCLPLLAGHWRDSE